MFDVSTAATSGTGTPGSPWAGWEATVNGLAANTSIYFPAGSYTQAARIDMKRGWLLHGDGKDNSLIKSSIAGTAFRSNFPLVTQNETYTAIRDLCIENTNGNNTGSGYLDVSGTFVEVVNVKIIGFRFGISLIKTQLGVVDRCVLNFQTGGGVWLVNNGDYNLTNADLDYSSAPTGGTNVIQITRCQFNHLHTEQGLPIVQIIDDGGYTHEFTHNNHNGGNVAIRMAGVLNSRIAASQFEVQQSDITEITYLPFHSEDPEDSVGPSGTVTFDSNFFSPSTGTNRCFNLSSVETLVLVGNNITSNQPATRNASNANTIMNVRTKVSGAALLDGTPAHLIDLGSDLTTAELRADNLHAGDARLDNVRAGDVRLDNNKALKINNTAAFGVPMLTLDPSNQMYVGHLDPLGVNNLYVQAGQNILFRRTTGATEVGGFTNGNAFFIMDGVTAPGATTGRAYLFVDAADGDLKVRFGDGVTKTLATDT